MHPAIEKFVQYLIKTVIDTLCLEDIDDIFYYSSQEIRYQTNQAAAKVTGDIEHSLSVLSLLIQLLLNVVLSFIFLIRALTEMLL